MVNLANKKIIGLFVLLFALVGGLVIYRLFAASALTFQFEKMHIVSGAKVVVDSSASGKRAVRVTADNAKPIHATVGLDVPIASIVVRARATNCGRQWPILIIAAQADGRTKTILQSKIKSGGWKDFARSGLSVSSSIHKFNILVTYKTKIKKCQTTLYLDRFQLNTITSGKHGGGGGGGGGSGSCPAGQKDDGHGACVCSNGATNVPDCNHCPKGYHYEDPNCVPDQTGPGTCTASASTDGDTASATGSCVDSLGHPTSGTWSYSVSGTTACGDPFSDGGSGESWTTSTRGNYSVNFTIREPRGGHASAGTSINKTDGPC